MFQQCVVAAYKDVQQAHTAVRILHRSDLPSDQVSLITKNLEDHPELEKELGYGDDSLQDAFVGAGVGSVLGMLAGASTIALVGGGVALVAGPLAGLATGAVVGSLLGGIEGWGVHSSHLTHYEGLVNNGSPLVIVQGDPLQVAEAHRLLKQTAYTELQVHAKGDDQAEDVS